MKNNNSKTTNDVIIMTDSNTNNKNNNKINSDNVLIMTDDNINNRPVLTVIIYTLLF